MAMEKESLWACSRETGGGQATAVTSGANISADDIISLVYTLKRPYRQNAKFILNDQTISSIRKLQGQ